MYKVNGLYFIFLNFVSVPSHDNLSSETVRSRVRRSVSMERTVEALVVVDHSMMEYHKDEDIETYVLTIMNLVGERFNSIRGEGRNRYFLWR